MPNGLNKADKIKAKIKKNQIGYNFITKSDKIKIDNKSFLEAPKYTDNIKEKIKKRKKPPPTRKLHIITELGSTINDEEIIPVDKESDLILINNNFNNEIIQNKDLTPKKDRSKSKSKNPKYLKAIHTYNKGEKGSKKSLKSSQHNKNKNNNNQLIRENIRKIIIKFMIEVFTI